MLRGARILALAFAVVGASTPVGAQVRSGGEELVYLATYEPSIHVLRESDLSVVRKIPMSTGITSTIQGLSADGTTFYMLSIDYEHVELVDRVRGESLGSFTLSDRNAKVRIRAFAAHPDGRHAALMTRRYEKLRDRWDIGDHELVLYDMVEKRVVHPIPWPDGESPEAASFAFSPDGRELHFFMDDVRIYDTETYTEVDRWDYADVLGPGIGAISFAFPMTYREEAGWHVGLFTTSEAYQDRQLIGVARANPTRRVMEATILGPLETGPRSRVSFSISADRRRAYGLHQELENYQIWAFDLVEGRATGVDFAGRPRMEIESSSNGELLYVYNAGNTIDVYDARTFEHLRTVELDADMIRELWVLPDPDR